MILHLNHFFFRSFWIFLKVKKVKIKKVIIKKGRRQAPLTRGLSPTFIVFMPLCASLFARFLRKLVRTFHAPAVSYLIMSTERFRKASRAAPFNMPF